jgi:hypothetical protein
LGREGGIEHYFSIELKGLEMSDNGAGNSSFNHYAPSNETNGMLTKLRTSEDGDISLFESDDSITST